MVSDRRTNQARDGQGHLLSCSGQLKKAKHNRLQVSQLFQLVARLPDIFQHRAHSPPRRISHDARRGGFNLSPIFAPILPLPRLWNSQKILLSTSQTTTCALRSEQKIDHFCLTLFCILTRLLFRSKYDIILPYIPLSYPTIYIFIFNQTTLML